MMHLWSKFEVNTTCRFQDISILRNTQTRQGGNLCENVIRLVYEVGFERWNGQKIPKEN